MAQMAELQITQEYTGQSLHLVYLAPMWKEFFSYVDPVERGLKGIAGVANTGDDTNWCGHPFSQSNWYAFGRLAWDPSLTSEQIAHEWLLQTFGRGDSVTVAALEDMMLSSREACVEPLTITMDHSPMATRRNIPWSGVPSIIIRPTSKDWASTALSPRGQEPRHSIVSLTVRSMKT